MSYEYRVITDKKTSAVDLDLIYNNLRNSSLFQAAMLTNHGIFVPGAGRYELVGLEIEDEGFFVSTNMNKNEIEVLLGIIRDTMFERGVKITIEEA